MRIAIAVFLPVMTGGCIGTVADVATAPVKVVTKTVDVLTTSQSEADQKRGRELRLREERLGRLERRRARLDAACETSASACRERDAVEAEIRAELDREI